MRSSLYFTTVQRLTSPFKPKAEPGTTVILHPSSFIVHPSFIPAYLETFFSQAISSRVDFFRHGSDVQRDERRHHLTMPLAGAGPLRSAHGPTGAARWQRDDLKDSPRPKAKSPHGRCGMTCRTQSRNFTIRAPVPVCPSWAKKASRSALANWGNDRLWGRTR